MSSFDGFLRNDLPVDAVEVKVVENKVIIRGIISGRSLTIAGREEAIRVMVQVANIVNKEENEITRSDVYGCLVAAKELEKDYFEVKQVIGVLINDQPGVLSNDLPVDFEVRVAEVLMNDLPEEFEVKQVIGVLLNDQPVVEVFSNDLPVDSEVRVVEVPINDLPYDFEVKQVIGMLSNEAVGVLKNELTVGEGATSSGVASVMMMDMLALAEKEKNEVLDTTGIAEGELMEAAIATTTAATVAATPNNESAAPK